MQRAATGLSKVLPKILRGASPEEIPLLVWPVICGQAVAARTRAVSSRSGVLRVEVADASWRSQLANLTPRYLRSFDQLLSTWGQQQAANSNMAPHVHSIEFVLPPGATSTVVSRPSFRRRTRTGQATSNH